MTIRKWNYKTKDYDKYEVPDDWSVVIFCTNMNEPVNCPHCGKQLPYGETYTSLEIHTTLGIGAAVCGECYEKENQRRKENE